LASDGVKAEALASADFDAAGTVLAGAVPDDTAGDGVALWPKEKEDVVEPDDAPKALLLVEGAFSSFEAGLAAAGAKEKVAGALGSVEVGAAGVGCAPKAKPENGFFAAGASASSELFFSLVEVADAGAVLAPKENPEKGEAAVDGAAAGVEAAGLEKENPEKGVEAGAAAGVEVEG